jgi:hypothetical protein
MTTYRRERGWLVVGPLNLGWGKPNDFRCLSMREGTSGRHLVNIKGWTFGWWTA